MKVTPANRETLAVLARFARNGGGSVSPDTVKRWEDRHFASSKMGSLKHKGLIQVTPAGVQLTRAGRKIANQGTAE